ncbi:hypothetical protein S40288_11163 [Stachybotrys chartarum IBT 40288]|nr:hypothetical protein S40288_11163 [Stachybotrys chartarum IBT 40288]
MGCGGEAKRPRLDLWIPVGSVRSADARLTGCSQGVVSALASSRKQHDGHGGLSLASACRILDVKRALLMPPNPTPTDWTRSVYVLAWDIYPPFAKPSDHVPAVAWLLDGSQALGTAGWFMQANPIRLSSPALSLHLPQILPPPPHEVGEEKEMSVDRIAPLARGAPLPTSRR